MDMWQMMNQMMGAWGTGMMLLNYLTGLLLFGLLVLAIVAAVRWAFGPGMQGSLSPRESALDMLKKRYARGELTKEEFEATRRDIA